MYGKFFSNSEFDQLTKKNEFDAGLDVCSIETNRIAPWSRTTIHTGLHVEIPEGFVGLLWSRSGLSAKHGIEVGAGCIDSTYRGEVRVVLYNLSDMPYTVRKGDKIAQLLTMPAMMAKYHQVQDLGELEDTDRGSGGFGSTGR